uniref:Uncharacterized protein n=1 Tax=Burkholderia phage vB_BgluM-SURPRISE13 TaxID=3159457 RepID=A0AAU7PH12_9VIRU
MARLNFSATRIEGHEVNLRRGDLPVRFHHPVREIDEHMDDIVYNAIDIIQERAKDNELRIHYFNMMSDNDYRNRDFEDIVGMIADVIDIALQEGRFRDVREAVQACTEDVILLHIGYMCDQYPDLMQYVERRNERDIDRAIETFIKYQKAVDLYRRNDNRVPRDDRRDRGRDRDDRYDDRDRGARFGSDRGSRDRDRPRRDRWDRGAVRGGVSGSPRRSVTTRENRFGNTDQDDRFDDETQSGSRRDDRREERDDERRTTRNRGDDRYEDGAPLRGESRGSRVQRLPGSARRDDDVEDALAREAQQEGKNMTSNEMSRGVEVSGAQGKNPTLSAYQNLDAWVPSLKYPHPLVFNHNQDLFYEMDLTNEVVIPRVMDKDQIVDYYAHASMAFGGTPKDFARFDDGTGGVSKRLSAMHEALLNPQETFNVEGTEDEVTYHSRLDLTEDNFMSYGMKDVLVRLNYRRFSQERKQPNGDEFHSVEIAVGSASIIDSFIATEDEAALLEELRQVSSFTKLCEKMRTLSKKLKPELWLQLDRYLTKAVNRMLRQHLSISALKISTFTGDWLELFAYITEKFGDGYRDAVNTHQEREIRNLFNYSQAAEIYVLTQLPEGHSGLKPFIVSMPTKMICLNEVGYNLDVDMVPEVASQILPETNSFFHDLAQDLLTKDGDKYGRFFIQTSDMRVIEASRSYLNDKAILLRMVV